MNLEFVFTFPNLLKTTREGHHFSLKLKTFSDELLCVVKSLVHYIDITKDLRKSRQLFISYVNYKQVTSSTISRWLKCILKEAGINVDVYKAHSFRGASVSAAFNKGCSLRQILDQADWASAKTFRKFYYREDDPSIESFDNAVLSGRI